MPAKKNAVTTPLHLLQQLSKSLVVHLEKACTDAQKDAEILLAKLEKQRGKTQEKLIKARAKLDEAGNAGKSKAQSKARARLAELDDMLALLQARQSETLSYLADLKSSTAARKPAATTRARPAASKVASGKSAAANTSSGQAAATSAAKRPARPASSRAKPKASTTKPSGAAKPAAARKPASAKAGSADQPAPPASS